MRYFLQGLHVGFWNGRYLGTDAIKLVVHHNFGLLVTLAVLSFTFDNFLSVVQDHLGYSRLSFLNVYFLFCTVIFLCTVILFPRLVGNEKPKEDTLFLVGFDDL